MANWTKVYCECRFKVAFDFLQACRSDEEYHRNGDGRRWRAGCPHVLDNFLEIYAICNSHYRI